MDPLGAGIHRLVSLIGTIFRRVKHAPKLSNDNRELVFGKPGTRVSHTLEAEVSPIEVISIMQASVFCDAAGVAGPSCNPKTLLQILSCPRAA